MLKTLNKHKVDFIWVAFLVVLLATIRAFEQQIFYDPFLEYFKTNYLYEPFPEYDSTQLYLNLIFRYILNTSISLMIIQVLFRKKAYLKLAVVFYLISLVILIITFTIAINFSDHSNYQYFFYIRRFLIHPLLLLLLIPAFYYQKKFA